MGRDGNRKRKLVHSGGMDCCPELRALAVKSTLSFALYILSEALSWVSLLLKSQTDIHIFFFKRHMGMKTKAPFMITNCNHIDTQP